MTKTLSAMQSTLASRALETPNEKSSTRFASASGVEAFIKELGAENAAKWEQERRKKPTKIGAIGAVTAERLEKYGIHADVIPEQCDIEHLIEEMAKEREV